jgi:GNAT superfamily N-acetyltransferase
MIDFVEYDESIHKENLFDMYLKLGEWLDEQVLTHHGFHLFTDGDVRGRMDILVPRFTSYDPSEAILLLLTVNGNIAGMTRLDKFSEGIGMIHNVYIYPEYRGRGLSKQMMYVIEEKARDFGFKFLRLDVGGFNIVAQKL